MGSASTELHLRWTSHETTLLGSVYDLWNVDAMTDVSLSADGRIIRAHKVVLSSCSSYFNGKRVLKFLYYMKHSLIPVFCCLIFKKIWHMDETTEVLQVKEFSFF